MTSPLRSLPRLFSGVTSHWRHSWRWLVHRRLFEIRHFRHLVPVLLVLAMLTGIWSALLLGLVMLSGNVELLRGPAFAQNVIASLLVLPAGIAVGVVVGTLLEKRSLRFKTRHAGDKLGDCVRLVLFELVLSLERDGGIPINLEGPTNHRFFRRARTSAVNAFSASHGGIRLPSGFDQRLQDSVRRMVACFRESTDLRLAYPLSFDYMDRLESLMASIAADPRSSAPENTTLIVLYHAIEIVQDLA
jgi:hypothetical protein